MKGKKHKGGYLQKKQDGSWEKTQSTWRIPSEKNGCSIKA